MRSLLLSGLGVTYRNSSYFDATLFRDEIDERAKAMLEHAGLAGVRIRNFSFLDGAVRRPLLRPPDPVPHLTSFTLESILEAAGQEYIRIPLEDVWTGLATAPAVDVDVILLSTTYIWNRSMLGRALDWARVHLPGVPIVAGGQYTNLKYANIMRAYPDVAGVVRGDAESALPLLLQTLACHGDLGQVPNLVWRDGDRTRINPLQYVDLETHPSPSFPGRLRSVPYESMRGCPFDCKFCSFPAASPKWRYKSAHKIAADWQRYSAENGAESIDAMDSTFTVPPTRLRELTKILPGAKVPHWSCFSRANVFTSPEFVEDLLAANCANVEIGFESMHDRTLKRMSKRVTAKQNRRAYELLSNSDLGFGTCFMVGYPGETAEEFEVTRRFIVDEHSGRFSLHLFSLSDETMPLWEDREELQIVVDDLLDPDSAWSHVGMNIDEARKLQAETLDEVRRRNDTAVASLWQREYQRPLLPTVGPRSNLVLEKAIERLALCSRDHETVQEAAAAARSHVGELKEMGVELDPGSPLESRP
ncbi:radical SAM superfamily enzyme YgiQ (UPF0313 family) [Micromonospora sp. Llam0]|uniref:B12-binding domain-containing radical SAM protein n=1 Tax=Micromonospora sp. Llam0 TaxID=2485143 RepID=UPI000FB373CA|nr:radical SAM protein [Micromonospora sp. Llam0]ROO60635.1 radical SAM superfamily enzyme YgiQ (UPF0313 family) [Micromonospora sp. Llam0]